MKLLTERYGTIGWEEFNQQKREMLSKYDLAKERAKNKPVKTEHGNVAEACFREWLATFLPQKFGVTSGYVIPDVRRSTYKLRHFDVIVYDSLNSPTLWVESDMDRSEQGRRLAVPAEYVYAIFELKATLTRKHISDAIAKLKEANDFATELPQNFTSGVVFFELPKGSKNNAALGEKLFDPKVKGYSGGIVLRAEGLDDTVSGYYRFADLAETDESMPLAKQFHGIKINEKDEVTLTEHGEAVDAISLDGYWHYSNGYIPNIANVLLIWSQNAFSGFVFDTLARLNGTYDPKVTTSSSYYGMSFLRK